MKIIKKMLIGAVVIVSLSTITFAQENMLKQLQSSVNLQLPIIANLIQQAENKVQNPQDLVFFLQNQLKKLVNFGATVHVLNAKGLDETSILDSLKFFNIPITNEIRAHIKNDTISDSLKAEIKAKAQEFVSKLDIFTNALKNIDTQLYLALQIVLPKLRELSANDQVVQAFITELRSLMEKNKSIIKDFSSLALQLGTVSKDEIENALKIDPKNIQEALHFIPTVHEKAKNILVKIETLINTHKALMFKTYTLFKQVPALLPQLNALLQKLLSSSLMGRANTMLQ